MNSELCMNYLQAVTSIQGSWEILSCQQNRSVWRQSPPFVSFLPPFLSASPCKTFIHYSGNLCAPILRHTVFHYMHLWTFQKLHGIWWILFTCCCLDLLNLIRRDIIRNRNRNRRIEFPNINFEATLLPTQLMLIRNIDLVEDGTVVQWLTLWRLWVCNLWFWVL